MCGRERDRGHKYTESRVQTCQRAREPERGKKDRTVKTSVFPFIIRNSDKENGP